MIPLIAIRLVGEPIIIVDLKPYNITISSGLLDRDHMNLQNSKLNLQIPTRSKIKLCSPITLLWSSNTTTPLKKNIALASQKIVVDYIIGTATIDDFYYVRFDHDDYGFLYCNESIKHCKK